MARAGKTTILLDMYGVILVESKGFFIPYTFGSFDCSEHERLTRLFREEHLFTKASNGEMTSDQFLTLLGFDRPRFHMENYIRNCLTLDPEFIGFAEQYHTQYDFVLLSNDISEWSAYITEYYNLNRYFRYKIVSGNVKCRKPDRKIFGIALETIGRNPEECCFVDNSVKNLMAAAELGIEPILFNRDHETYTGITVHSFTDLGALL